MTFYDLIYLIIAMLCAFFISLSTTPIVRVLAYKIGAVDVPKDNRRMHKVAMPLMGGLAIFIAFTVTSLVFNEVSKQFLGMLLGAFIIIITGIIDDIYNMNPFVKLTMQVISALVAAGSGIRIEHINLFGHYINFNAFSYVVTVIWFVALTNAVNLIDGLDGLSCGVSTISAVTILVSSFFLPEKTFSIVLLTAILAGSCAGFLPFNLNPAKIFMGDTGALFLGYILAAISILGFFKINAIVAFWVPFLAFAFPLADTSFAFLRRIFHGKSPFTADRGHIHHKLIDMGFNQRQSVAMLYAISSIMGVAAILFAMSNVVGGIVILVFALIVFVLNWALVNRSNETRGRTGLSLLLSEIDEKADEPENTEQSTTKKEHTPDEKA